MEPQNQQDKSQPIPIPKKKEVKSNPEDWVSFSSSGSNAAPKSNASPESNVSPKSSTSSESSDSISSKIDEVFANILANEAQPQQTKLEAIWEHLWGNGYLVGVPEVIPREEMVEMVENCSQPVKDQNTLIVVSGGNINNVITETGCQQFTCFPVKTNQNIFHISNTQLNAGKLPLEILICTLGEDKLWAFQKSKLLQLLHKVKEFISKVFPKIQEMAVKGSYQQCTDFATEAFYEKVRGLPKEEEKEKKEGKVESWNNKEVVEWLQNIGFAQYNDKFKDFDGPSLLGLNNDVLKDIKVDNAAHRSKIMFELEKLRK